MVGREGGTEGAKRETDRERMLGDSCSSSVASRDEEDMLPALLHSSHTLPCPFYSSAGS